MKVATPPDAADVQRSQEAAAQGPDAPGRRPPWRVLVVDDDDDVHVATELAMRDLTVEGRPLQFVHARSSVEAYARLAADPGIAVVLLDVVMESPDAGLRLARRARQELGRTALRIILRTGQPGYAPEIETLRDYDINDYRTKAELTRVRLYTSLAVAIRSYAQLSELERQRDELMQLNASLQQARAAEHAEAERRAAAEAALRRIHETMDQCVEQRTRELSKAVADLDGFTRMVSHDLRGPLQGLAGLSGLMQRELGPSGPEKLRRWLGLMETQTHRLADMVGELLALARVSSGALQRSPVALGQVAQEALEALALGQEGERVAQVKVAPLPELSVDAGLMRQALVNLLSNALKFSRGVAQPEISLSAERQGDAWVFSVRDNGVGFDVGRAGELFQPFKRLHGPAIEGTGIGLTIVRRVIERHGGRVWAEGAPGQGACFHFTLPAA